MVLQISVFFLFSLILLPWKTLSFSPRRLGVDGSRAQRSILEMGGYYSEPEDTSGGLLDRQNRHMLFGLPCVEERFVVNSIPITNLVPLEQEEDEETNYTPTKTTTSTEQLVQYIQSNKVDVTNKSVLEIGSSAVSLAAVLALGASSVVVCHPDPAQLQIWEHGYRFFNTHTLSCPMETRQIYWPLEDTEDDSSPHFLPPVDFIFVTLDEQGQAATSLENKLLLSSSSPMLAPILSQARRNGSRVIMVVAPSDGQQTPVTEDGDAIYSIYDSSLDIVTS